MMNNIHLKILSIILALFLWVMVVAGQVETESISVPVKLTNVPAGSVAVPSVQNVSVTVKGAAKVLKNMKYSSIIFNIDVSSFSSGDSTRRILPEDFKTPLGVEVIETTPKELVVTIDQTATKTVKVVPAFIGDVEKGFKVKSVSVKPVSVEIEGARSKIRGVNSVMTLPVNISGIKDSSVFTIGFKQEDGVKRVKPETVEVRLTMRSEVIKKDIEGIPVSCMDLQNGLSMKTKPRLDSVTVSGRADLVESFAESSSFIVNCAQITKPGKYTGTVAYKSGVDGVDVIAITPQKINFEIK